MSFAKKPERPKRRPASIPFAGASLSKGLLVRTLIVGLIAIGGAAWALDRHYTHALPAMRVPSTPRAAPTYDADAGEFPVPDIFGDDARD